MRKVRFLTGNSCKFDFFILVQKVQKWCFSDFNRRAFEIHKFIQLGLLRGGKNSEKNGYVVCVWPLSKKLIFEIKLHKSTNKKYE